MAIKQNIINANSSSPLSTEQGGTGVSAPTEHGVLIGQGSSAVTSQTLTNGQLIVGSTGADPVAATLTAGAGISITNGAGSIAIATVANAINKIVVKTITASGTYTPTAGMRFCHVEIIGGGGGAGSIPPTGAGEIAASGGGGSGSYTAGLFTAADIGSSQSVTIGAGGLGGTDIVTGENGSMGGTSSFGSLMTANAGDGSGFLKITSGTGCIFPGSSGSSGSGGYIQHSGNFGTPAYLSIVGSTFSVFSPIGAPSKFSGGALAYRVNASIPGGVGDSGRLYGGGAGGSTSNQNQPGRVGSNGADGICIITEYISE